MTRPDHAIDAYLEGQLTDEQARAIDQWIAADPANAAAFLHLARTHQMLGILGKENKLARESSAIKPETIDHATLASLAEMEANAEPIPYSFIDQPFSFEPKGQGNNDITLMRALDDLRWAAGKAATKLICSPYGITGTIAAILILGIYLFVPFGSTDPAPPQDIADNTSTQSNDSIEPGRVGPVLNTPVATLTASHNAVWSGRPASAGLATGDTLHPGDRLTLTAGFAEITTNDGAVAILQAPATIQLINNNALHLYAGKLVGICETDSSKGFLVHTPHLHITDLGTRFGIDTSADATEVHVFEGEVQAERVGTAADAAPATLVANQSARTSADTDTIARIDHDADRFAALLPTTIELPGTGFGLKAGDTDPNWQIVAIDGQMLDTPQSVRVYNIPGYTGDVPNDPASAQWVGMLPTQHAQPGGWITYRFQTRVSLPKSIDPKTAQLALSYTADNHVRAILVNGQRIEMDDAMDEGRWTVRDVVINKHLIAGENTIAFEVENHTLPGTTGAGEVALYARWAWQQPAHTAPTPAPER